MFYASVVLTIGRRSVHVHGPPHTVDELPSEADYTACSFSGAVSSDSSGSTAFTFDKAGTRYFACATYGVALRRGAEGGHHGLRRLFAEPGDADADDQGELGGADGRRDRCRRQAGARPRRRRSPARRLLSDRVSCWLRRVSSRLHSSSTVATRALSNTCTVTFMICYITCYPTQKSLVFHPRHVHV